MLSFVASFLNTYSCKICYASHEEIKTLTQEVNSLLREKQKHKIHSETLNTSATGVKEGCAFH